MARCRPIFPSLDSGTAPGLALPSSLSTSASLPPVTANIIERMASAHARLEPLPDVLSPPSRSPSPNSQSRATLFQDKLQGAVASAGSPANPDWGRISRSLKMACTSRLYRGVPQGIRIGEHATVEVGNYKWVLPEKVEEWQRCEEDWLRRFSLPTADVGQPSKYWPANNIEPPQSQEERKERSPSKAELVRDKVRAWQATVISVTNGAAAKAGETTEVVSDMAKDPGDVAMEVAPRMKQPPISFPVVKASASAGNRVDKVRASSIAPLGMPPPLPSAQLQTDPQLFNSVQLPKSDPIGIANVSEMSFLPPSFPPQLKTSTPPLSEKAKPSPILPIRHQTPLPSSSLERLNPAIMAPEANSLSPLSSPTWQMKHIRSPSLPRHNNASITSEGPPPKKQRTDTSPFVQSSAPFPPSTPPPSMAAPHTPSPLLRKGLGNAKGLPIPTTPDQGALPTLTELLASTRKSKPRPRPPSRKAKSIVTTSAAKATSIPADQLPMALVEPRESSPAPTVASRARTVFSSPASGSSDSPQLLRERPRSPVSPLFSNKFAPPFTSTQQNGAGAGNFEGMAASQVHGTGLANNGSEVFGMGYNSQFDLEGQIGLVSDLLERDVDFDGWLRDIPEVDAEG